jgi:hypothetical protein
MLSKIPYAEFYSVSAIEAPAAPIAVGGIKEMDYVADLLNDEQLVLYTGIADEECILIFNVEWKQLASIVDTARSNMKEDDNKEDSKSN